MKPTILIVDDEPAIRESLAYALERDGFRAAQAGSLKKARAASRAPSRGDPRSLGGDMPRFASGVPEVPFAGLEGAALSELRD